MLGLPRAPPVVAVISGDRFNEVRASLLGMLAPLLNQLAGRTKIVELQPVRQTHP